MKSILAGLLLISWTALSQPSTGGADADTDTLYCVPIRTARLLISDALRLPLADSINNSLYERVSLLEAKELAVYRSFTNLLKIEQEKVQYHKEISAHMESLYLSEREQKEYYIKRERKQRRKKNVLTYLGVGLIILVLVK